MSKLEKGIKGKLELIVDESNTAKAVGSGMLPVLATPALIALAEKTAWTSVSEYLEDGQGTVGTKVDISHMAPTPMNKKVTCETTLAEIDRKRLVFEVTVYDEASKVAEGTHERFIIDNERFLQKAEERA